MEEVAPVFHEFIARYKKEKKSVYGFVEGKDDPSFYKGFIEHTIPQDWSVELWMAGNKDKVIQLMSNFDWSRFPVNRVAFFIDRDLSCFVDEKLPNVDNVYITDQYSIENDVVNRSTCDRVITEICNLRELSPEEKDVILDLFEAQKNVFLDALAPVMSWIIYWKRNAHKSCLNDIYMKHLFTVNSGKLQICPTPKDKASCAEYIHTQCNIVFNTAVDITPIEQEFRFEDKFKIFCRGKYLLWFLVEFALSVHRDIANLNCSITASPKMNVSMSQSNGVLLIAPRARIPITLKSFIERTFCNYIAEVA